MNNFNFLFIAINQKMNKTKEMLKFASNTPKKKLINIF